MVDETDGVSETFDAQLRIALTIASQMGERIARLREQSARQREAHASQEARELEGRFDAERATVRASLVPVHRDDWWDQATVQQIADAHETATVWRSYDPDATNAAARIRDEVRDRYGINVDVTGVDRTAIARVLEDAERDRATAIRQRQDTGEELAASQLLIAAADRRDADAHIPIMEQGADVPAPFFNETPEVGSARPSGLAAADRSAAELEYDNAERRERFAASLEGTVDQRTLDARLMADSDQARHPREAVHTMPHRARNLRTGPLISGQQREQGDLTR